MAFQNEKNSCVEIIFSHFPWNHSFLKNFAEWKFLLHNPMENSIPSPFLFRS